LNIKRNIVNAQAKILDKDKCIIAEGEGTFWAINEADK